MANSKNTRIIILRIIFFVYLLVLIKLIVFKYPGEQLMVIVSGWSNEVVKAGLMSANFTPFRTITMYIRYADRLNSFENLVGNIVAFIPFGFILPMIVRWGGKLLILFLHVFIFVVGIEIFQLFSAFGVFDVDDILLNCLGAVIGWLAYRTLWQERFKSLV